ncbi:undecaprenyl-phosphate glucose phosphotransferase [Methylococcus sp. EFPC2]|uniref:undecaprenyl-phosphate glucose phosphotransferase n=1 Tax=Methylococcus sp. EFPC2 TaxID=2812648 RepID=UPI0019680006|nr:undecaprenyl-phosphate glucose phosphotransferase [Methylococcus sp. EFPC2]QSA98578.1 undecaprenyl-phosphate glucose phosphotransferase [Methylococcus sp. EFPC2]
MPIGFGHLFRQGLFRRYGHTTIVLLRLLDVALLFAGGWAAYFLWLEHWNIDEDYRVALAVGLLAAIILFEITGVYRPWRGSLRGDIGRLLRAWTFALLAVVGVVAIVRSQIWFGSSYRWIATWGVLGLTAMAGARLILAAVLRRARALGWFQGRILMVGLNPMAIASVKQLDDSPWAGLQVIGYLDDRAEPRFTAEGASLPRLGSLNEVAEIVARESVDEVWVAFPFRGEARAEQVLHALRHLPVSIRLVIDCFAFRMSKFLNLNEVAGIPTLDISVSPLHGINRYIKEFEDRSLALLALLLASPLMGLIALGVKLSSPGPVFYRQVRVGWNNRPFTMLKFRSMPVNTEAQSGPVWAKPGENRATPFGSFLRKSSLDELPQLINVLRGDMSLVGPRPERPDFVEVFKDQVPQYMKKHLVKAGITGWAQVNGWRGDTDLNRRIEHDLYYIQNWSLWFDLEIALRTVVHGFVNKNAY